MNRKAVLFVAVFLMLVSAAMPAWAELAEAVATTGEGAVGLPVSLLKLVGGIVWTVGEVIVLPFKAF